MLALGIPGHDGAGAQHGMDPGDQAQAPIARIQTDHTWMQLIEADGRGEEGLKNRRAIHDQVASADQAEMEGHRSTDKR